MTDQKSSNRPRVTRAPHASLLVGVFALFLFSFYLMFHTFSYNSGTHEILIASKAWSDFGAHIPLIRSFSYGPNLARLFHGQPVESPLFPGEPIRYHFGFYALVGLLEKLGVRIDWALNIPSALGFFLLLGTIYLLSYILFTDRRVSLLSVIFFLFNGSLSALRFFQSHPLNPNTVTDIITNSRFPAFGPWDGNTITAFWTLNIYTNQRHLGLSYGIILSILCLLLLPSKKPAARGVRDAITIAILSSLLLFFNYPAALILAVCCLAVFAVRPDIRLPLASAGVMSLPALFLLYHVAHISSDIVWQPGYLASPLTPTHFVQFWFDNLGLQLLFIPLGLLFAPRSIRRMFLGPLLVLFILPNLFRFSPDMINNHKFFNFFLVIGNMFSAYALFRILKLYEKSPHKQLRKLLQIITGIVFVVALTLSGIIDFFPIVNDTKGAIPDVRVNNDAQFFLYHIAPTAIIANSTWFYHPASIAGRSLFSGYTYFTWSYGYNQVEREQILKNLYNASDLRAICSILGKNHIAAVELNPKPESYLAINFPLWLSFPAAYENTKTGLKVFLTRDLCTNITTH